MGHASLCGDSPSSTFMSHSTISQCWQWVFFIPAAFVAVWWGAGSVIAAIAHARKPSCNRPGMLDCVRLCFTFGAAMEGLLKLSHSGQDREPYEVLQGTLECIPWGIVFFLLCGEIAISTKENMVVLVSPALAFLAKAGMLAALMADDDTENDKDHAFEIKWQLAATAWSGIAAFSVTCLARPIPIISANRDQHAASSSLSAEDPLLTSLLQTPSTDGSGDTADVIVDIPRSPEDSSGLFSRLTYMWVTPLMQLGFSRPLTLDDLPPVREEDSSTVLASKFEHAMGEGHHVIKALYVSGVISPFLWAAPLKLVFDVLTFTSPQILRAIINHLTSEKDLKSNNDDNDNSEWYNNKGAKLSLLLFAVVTTQTLLLHAYFGLVFRAGMRVRSVVVTSIYLKTLRLSSTSRLQKPIGEITALFQSDTRRLQDLFPYLHVCWSSPVQVALALYFLAQELHLAVIVSCIMIFVMMVGLTGLLARVTQRTSAKLQAAKDIRIKRTSEALGCIKAIKLYGWERFYRDRIEEAREEELKLLRKYTYLRALNRVLWGGTPVVVTLATFASYVAMGGKLDAAKAFVSLTLLTLLRFPLSALPMIFNNVIDARVSLNRVDDYLQLNELKSVGRPFASANSSRRNSFSDLVGHRHSDPPHSAAVVQPVGVIAAAAAAAAAARTIYPTNERDDLFSPHPHFITVPPALIATASTNSLLGGGAAIEVTRGTFYWDDDRHVVALQDINLRIERGETVMLLGEVGAGKTALLYALFGELVPSNDALITVAGDVSYAAQVPWIRNATVRENILFGKPYESRWYQQVIHACALAPDLEQLPAGDFTEIGERGVSLSGGQKARISLARAVYSRSEIVVLESVFEAVDEHVGAHIWRECIMGVLKSVTSQTSGVKRTVILVTHAIKNLEESDRVILMKTGGLVDFCGTPHAVLTTPRFQGMLQALQAAAGGDDRGTGHDSNDDDATTTATAPSTTTTPTITTTTTNGNGDGTTTKQKVKKTTTNNNSGPKTKGKSTTDESSNAILYAGTSTYVRYFSVMGGCGVVTGVLMLHTLRMLADVSTSRFLAHWAQQGDEANQGENVAIFGSLSLSTVLLMGIATVVVMLSSLSASRVLASRLLLAMTRAPLAFFDITPLGRVLSRFTNDVNALDQILPDSINTLLMTLFDVLGTVVVIAMTAPWFLLFLPFLAGIYISVQRYYVRASRELKRLDLVSLSPIHSNFLETLDGATSVRAYHKTDEFIRTNKRLLDLNLKAFYASVSGNRWLAVRLESVANAMVFITSMFLATSKGTDPAMAGFACSYALTVTQTLNWCVRMASDFESQVVSVDRIEEYCEVQPEPLVLPVRMTNTTKPYDAEQWPSQGKIVFSNVRARYRAELPEVLKGVSFEIQPMWKVGICGRTGSGKSTLLMLMLRALETTDGVILIDDVDIRGVELDVLRSKLAIVPQDPVLFNNTVRYNLDPSGKVSDVEMWQALESCQVDEHIRALPGGLDHVLAESGASLSFGQRQLLCIVRALLRKTRVLLCDEPTSALDNESERLVNEAIDKVMESGATIIIIAHRMTSIRNADKIIVFDNGLVLEQGTHDELMGMDNGMYASLVKMSAGGGTKQRG